MRVVASEKETVMNRAFLPFKFLPTHAARAALGRELEAAAILALRAILRHHRSLEIAHQQISFRQVPLAFSSRITERGELVMDIDVGDPRLAGRLILEDELREARGRPQSDARGLAKDKRR